MWSFDLTGMGRFIDKRPVVIEEQLTEVLFPQFAQRHVLALARYDDTDEKIMVKIRYDLQPQPFGITDTDRNLKCAEHHFLEEIKLVEDVEDIGHGPEYITHVTQPAGQQFPYPQGHAWFIVMRTVPGENLNNIHQSLPEDDLKSIRTQLTRILEHMRQCWFLLSEQHPSFLRYDRENRKLYIVDYTFMDLQDPSHPLCTAITEDSSFVYAFDIWRDQHLSEMYQQSQYRRRGNVPSQRLEQSQNITTRDTGNIGSAESSEKPK